MSLQLQARRRRARKAKAKPRKMHTIRAKINYTNCLLRTPDHGSFASMYRKYGQKGYIYFCADVFNENDEPNYRLDSDFYPGHTAASLRAYGHKKAWIMPNWRMNGKKVILVKEAAKVEMTMIFDNTTEIRAFLEWLRFQSKRLKVPESQVLAAFAREWKAETLEIVIPPPRPRKGRPVI